MAMRFLIVVLAVCSLGTLAASQCEAQTTYTWTGNFDTRWQTDGNWSPHRDTPASDDVLQFNNMTATVTEVPTQTIGQLVLASGANVTLEAEDADNELTIATESLPVTGLDVPSGCTLTTGSPGLKLTLDTNVSAEIDGMLALGAAFTNTVTTTVNGTLQFNSGGSWSGNPPDYGDNSTLKYSSTGTFPRGLEWSYTSGAGYPANVQISNSTTLDLGANGGAAVTRAMSGNLTIDSGSKLGMNESGNVMTGNLIVPGNVTVAGTLELGRGAKWSETGSIEVGGDFDFTGGQLLIGPVDIKSARVTFNGSGAQVVSASGTLDFPSIFIDKPSGNVQLTCDALVEAWEATGLAMLRGDLELNGHTLNVAPGSYFLVNGVHTMYGPGTLYEGAGLYTYTTGGSGSLTIPEGVTVSLAGGINIEASTAVMLNGVLEERNGGSGAGMTYGPNSTLRYKADDVSRGAFTEWGGSGTSAPVNVEITCTPGHTSVLSLTRQSSQFTDPHLVRGNLTVSAGCTFRQGSGVALTVQGNFSLAGTMDFPATGDLVIAGNWTLGDAGSFVPSGHEVVFNGSQQSSVIGATTFDDLTVDGAGISLTNADITVNQVLTFTSGNITTWGKKVILGGSGSISRTSGYVSGNLQMPVAVGTGISKTFPIGDASSYAPVVAVFDTVTTAGYLIASATPGDHPEIASSTIDPALSVNHYWTLTNGGVGFDQYDATFSFWAWDRDPGASTDDFIVGRYDSTWSYPTVGAKSDTSTQATGLTAFGSFAVGEPAPPPACFEAPQAFPTGEHPSSVAIGDLDGDGKPDLAVANSYDSSVSVLLGDGAGFFGGKHDFPTGTWPVSVAIGDLNGDVNLDLAVANYNGSSVSVLLGDGTGFFGGKHDFPTGTWPASVAIGDLNGDENLDLAVASAYDATVSVLLGDGTGLFGGKTDFPTGIGPTSVAIGDLNGDVNLDLAVANRNGSSVSVLLGDGTGFFGGKHDFPTGTWPTSVAIADLNGDVNLDLAVANINGPTISVLLGDGTGLFGGKTDFPTGIGPTSVAIADLNGDVNLDLAVASCDGATVSVLLGDGAGFFGGKHDFPTGGYPYSVAIGDLNGVGNLDLAVANLVNQTVSVLLNCTDPHAGVVEPPIPAPPQSLQFLAPWPNPTRGASEIRFLLPTACTVDVALYNIAGRKVRSLASGALLTPGEHTIRWDGRDSSGSLVGSGVYFVQVRAGAEAGVRKLIVLR